jgi:hypothetical protein
MRWRAAVALLECLGTSSPNAGATRADKRLLFLYGRLARRHR